MDMEKLLSDMTNEELWQLFPIILTSHKSHWKDDYKNEERILKDKLGCIVERVNHIGSTAVPGLLAKPTIDVLLEIKEDSDISQIIKGMEESGYIYSYQSNKPAPHMMFMKGYTPNGFEDKVYHVHVRYPGDWDELYFRDYLISHSQKAEEYGLLKLRLKEEFEHDRDAYTRAKSDFIRMITRKAKSLLQKDK